MSDRTDRIKEEIKREVSVILQREVKDPRLGFVSVTDVSLSRDLSHCKIYVSVLGDESEKQETMVGLRKATGFIRSEIGRRVRLRHVPDIVFLYDPSLEYGSKINDILKEIMPSGGE